MSKTQKVSFCWLHEDKHCVKKAETFVLEPELAQKAHGAETYFCKMRLGREEEEEGERGAGRRLAQIRNASSGSGSGLFRY